MGVVNYLTCLSHMYIFSFMQYTLMQKLGSSVHIFFQIVHLPSPLMSSLSLSCLFKAIIYGFLALDSNIYSQHVMSSVIPIFYFCASNILNLLGSFQTLISCVWLFIDASWILRSSVKNKH